MTECLKCKSQNVVPGRLVDARGGTGASIGFKPGMWKWYQFELTSGTPLNDEAFACLDCGLIWGSANAELLREMVKRHTKPE